MNSVAHGVVARYIHSVSQVVILVIYVFFPQVSTSLKWMSKRKKDYFPTQGYLTGPCNGEEMFPVL